MKRDGETEAAAAGDGGGGDGFVHVEEVTIGPAAEAPPPAAAAAAAVGGGSRGEAFLRALEAQLAATADHPLKGLHLEDVKVQAEATTTSMLNRLHRAPPEYTRQSMRRNKWLGMVIDLADEIEDGDVAAGADALAQAGAYIKASDPPPPPARSLPGPVLTAPRPAPPRRRRPSTRQPSQRRSRQPRPRPRQTPRSRRR